MGVKLTNEFCICVYIIRLPLLYFSTITLTHYLLTYLIDNHVNVLYSTEFLSGDAINLTSITSTIGITGAMCAFAISCSFVILFIGYKRLAKRRVMNPSSR